MSINSWEMFKGKVVELANKKPKFNLAIYPDDVIRIVKLNITGASFGYSHIGMMEFDKDGIVSVSQGGERFSVMARDRTYDQMFNILENLYD